MAKKGKKDTIDTKEHLTVYVPENFSAGAILNPAGFRKDQYLNLKNGMYFILDVIIRMSQQRKWRDYYDLYGGYPVQSRILNQIIGNRYTSILNLLESHGVITRGKSYQTGSQSKLIAFTDKYATANHRILTLSKDAPIVKRIQQNRIEHEKRNQAELLKISYVTKWFDAQRLTLDSKSAHSFIEFYKMKMSDLTPDPLPKGRTEEEVKARINLRVNSMVDTFKKVDTGYWGLKKTGQDRRLHSVVSNTKKELRSLYLYDGQPMVSIDIKASQPFLLTLLLNPTSWGEKNIVSQVFPEILSKITKTKLKHLNNALLMFGTFSETLYQQGFQGNGFQDFNWEDDFYHYLVDKAKMEGDTSVFPDRATVKRKMMMILFDDGAYMENDPGFLSFSKWFPKEATLISMIKKFSREAKLKEPNEEGLNFLPILLQRIESQLILEKACKRVTEELPDAPIIPVHDCVMTTEDYSKQVAEVIKKVLQEETGLIPGIKIEKGTASIDKNTLEMLVAEDLREILENRPKGDHNLVGLKEPILYEPPDLDGDWIVYSRYDDQGPHPSDEVIIHLIDDTKG